MSGLFFNLFGFFSNTKNVSSKEKENCFLVYSATFVTRKMYVQNNHENAF